MKLILIAGVLLGTLLSDKTAPTEAELAGRWDCTGSRLVFMDKSGPLPDKGEVDVHLKAMGASENNCELTFTEGHRVNFRLSNKDFDLDWSLDPTTHEFKVVAYGWFKIKGYLLMEEDKVILLYRRKELFIMLRFLCTGTGRKHIAPLGNLLDATDGLTVAMEFSPA